MASTFQRDPSPSPSISSIASNILDVSPEEKEVRAYVKRILMKRIFLGHYQERRYVENIKLYRDVVVLHRSEAEFKVDIDNVFSKLTLFFKGEKWIGMTSPETIGGPAAGYCLWTKLQDVPFGFYWFQIKRIHYDFSEIRISLKVVRSVNEGVETSSESHLNFRKSISENMDAFKSCIKTGIDSLKGGNLSSSSPTHCCSTLSTSDEAKQEANTESCKSTSMGRDKVVPNSTSDDYANNTKKISLKFEDLISLLRLTVHCLREILMFMSVAIVGTLNGLGKCVHYVGEFSLRFMHEIGFLLRTVTPIILAVIELVGKLMGGLYLLIAMIIRDSKRPNPPPQAMPQIQNRQPLAIEYNRDLDSRMSPPFQGRGMRPPVQERGFHEYCGAGQWKYRKLRREY